MSSLANYESILSALQTAGVRYVVAGGFAVNLHGFLRFTKDLDVLIDLLPANAALAMDVLDACGLKPRAPVPLCDFADADKRREWAELRNMLVFQLWHPSDPFCTVDIFIRNPIDFERLWERAVIANFGDTECRIAGLEDLIAMKTLAGRPQDLHDIEQLRRIETLQRNAPDDV